ncbi:zf-DHHC-domain-containing protein [Hyaloscypha variabilis F]|uniref:Palmitoyltransferase PFA4 n=1 Tax=Hyaloscypha variabilis (strain UAMH 11265 / GT02V1 / F) TaxID=1149755 RepID=A0A2J6RID9_HYAVF|nr:zf-DHHC-domain-containing protein [Hyaloscypha variabilis F]
MTLFGLRPPCPFDSLEDLAIPAASFLIIFLAYTSQYLFYYIEPGPLTKKEAIWFNVIVAGIWWCYDRACSVDPGPKGWIQKTVRDFDDSGDEAKVNMAPKRRRRWCKKCDAPKPPRAHHCRRCGRCIPKMDHHCPWTTNCVSHTTFPHFLRFVLYAVISMSILAYHLFVRAAVIFSNRNLPAYLGPPTWAMAHLFVLILVNSVTLFALFILFVRATYSLAINTTMIESWEIERHEALVDRARKTGGWVYGNGGQKVRIEHQEFPYDIGIWKNLVQGMGTPNVLLWFLPFGRGPSIDTAAEFEVNGFEDESKSWPPPDPDKFPRVKRKVDVDEDFEDVGDVEAFRRRQQGDYERRRMQGEAVDSGRLMQPLGDEDDPFGPYSPDPVKRDRDAFEDEQDDYESEVEEGIDGEEGWTNAEGDRLRDFGVDEDADLLAEEEIPLGELLRRRKARAFT